MSALKDRTPGNPIVCVDCGWKHFSFVDGETCCRNCQSVNLREEPRAQIIDLFEALKQSLSPGEKKEPNA